MEKIVELKKVSKTYKIGEKEFKALDNIDLSINKGEFVDLMILCSSNSLIWCKASAGCLQVCDRVK